MNSFKELLSSKDKRNPISSKGDLVNIKNIYILKRIINHLEKIKLLKMIKYNKLYQNKLLLTTKDFKEGSESIPIEIEIIPVKNKYGKFINFLLKTDKQYYKIYFNNGIQEIKEII